jgi:hypothetical protein
VKKKMGTWGPGLYQDDIAEDVKTEYIDMLKSGGESLDITQEIIDRNREIIDDEDEAPVFWFSLADTQWQYGRLTDEVKEKALHFLDMGSDWQRWRQENPGMANKRKEVLEKLRLKLYSTQPKIKKITQPRLYRCEWKINDVYAYLLENDLAKTSGLYHHYALLHKIDEYRWYPGHIIPIVRLKVTKEASLPDGMSEINELAYLPTGGINNNPSNLYDYVIVMISTSRRIIPKKLIYLGNFPNLEIPANQEIIKGRIGIGACNWIDFEPHVIHLYNHYLR